MENIDRNQLDAVEEQTANIVNNLKYIEYHDQNFDALEKQTNNIVVNLKTIEALHGNLLDRLDELESILQELKKAKQ